MLAARRLRQCGAVAAARCLPRPRTMTVTTAPCRLHAHRRGLSAAAAAAPAPSPHPVRTPIQRIQKDILYCKTQVQQHDNDQYLCSLLLPGEARAGVHIVRAFNLELAHLLSRHSIPTVGVAPVQDVFGEAAKHNAAVRAAAQLSEEHEPTEAELNSVRVGLMKLQWWRDGLESAIEKVDSLQLHPQQAPDESTAAAAHAQPVLNMLAIAMKQYKLTPQLIARMIEARERSLEEGQPADIPALLAYSEQTAASLLHLTLECVGVRNQQAVQAASHIGQATGIALTLRSIPYSASKQQVLLPKSLVKQHHLDLSTLLAGQNSAALSQCVSELASIARDHIAQSRQLMAQVPREARMALVSATLCDRFLARLERHRFHVFAPELGLLPTVSKGAVDDPAKELSTAGVTLSGSQQGLQPMWLRLHLLKHQLRGTY